MRLLIINYDFPPAGGAGIKRCLKFMKFLPLFGWNCTVLTVKNGNHTVTDESLCNEIEPDVSIYRATTLESFVVNRRSCGGNGQLNSNKAEATHFSKRYVRKVYKALGKFFKIPDSRILWLPFAIVAALRIRIHGRNAFDAIYATGPTFVNLIVGAIVNKITGKPLVCDFRDAWISDPMNRLDEKQYRFKMQNKLEKFVVSRSDLVITTNPFVTKDFRDRYADQPTEKFVTIYNGYDMDDFAALPNISGKHSDKFTFVYTGILYGERTPQYFLKALSLALTEKPDMRNGVHVSFVGVCKKFLDGKTVDDYLRQYKLHDVVELTGHVSRKKSLEYQMAADALLLIIGIVPEEKELTYGISGKIFDYLLSGRPVVTLANGGATREFIVENKIGEIFYHNDIVGIKNYIINSYEMHKTRCDNGKRGVPEFPQFNFRHLTGKLAENLNRITGSAASQGN